MAYNIRTRNAYKKEVEAHLKDSSSEADFSESESEYEQTSPEISSDESSEKEDGQENGSISLAYSKPDKNGDILKKKATVVDKIYVIKSDDYFSFSSQRKAKISNNNLGMLETPKLQQTEIQKLLSDKHIMIKHKKELQLLDKVNRQQFNRWLLLLQEGFNILLYGFGSKINIMRDFQESCLKDQPVIVVNGFFPSLTIKNILDAIGNVIELKDNLTNIQDSCDQIAEELEGLEDFDLYLLIHNIEGDMLKNNKTQQILSKLAAVKNIHLVATIDHISAPLIWDNFKLSNFNFLWFDTTSFEPYVQESLFNESLLSQHSKSIALSSLKNVFTSLTSNSKGIYLKLVNYQLQHGEKAHYGGLLFKDLYALCRDAFLVSSDLALRSQLTEFIDHKMVKLKRNIDGSECLVVPSSRDVLQQFFDEHSSK